VLILFAVFRAEVTLFVPLAVAVWMKRRCKSLRTWAVILTLALLAPTVAWISADFVEHYAMKPAFGTTYNPFVRAPGEWEGWNGPTRSEDLRAWNAVKCGKPPRELAYWGDPGSGSFCHE
jgi:hypothetical protein